MIQPLHSKSVFNSSNLHRCDRLLVLGASGWFGRTLQSLLPVELSVLATAKVRRQRYSAWDIRTVKEFRPTIVANFAFMTQGKIEKIGQERYISGNVELTQRFLQVLEMRTVRTALTVSSGAAILRSDEPYGKLKLIEERAALERASDTLSVVVARAYSVTGPLVTNPQEYAFSEMIISAMNGGINVKSQQPTFRRYVSVEDYLTVSLFQALQGISGVIESGGELIEVGALAERITKLVNPRAHVQREPLLTATASTYASDGASWEKACSDLDYEPEELNSQIARTAKGLGERGYFSLVQ